MSAIRAIGLVVLLTFIGSLGMAFVFSFFYVWDPIPANQSLSWFELAGMGSTIGAPLGASLGAIAGTFGVLNEKRPSLDYVLAGAIGGVLATNSAMLLFALGEPVRNLPLTLAGLIVGGLIGSLRNTFWRGKPAGH